jgi:membrane protease YdiL (CAAX protease family)
MKTEEFIAVLAIGATLVLSLVYFSILGGLTRRRNADKTAIHTNYIWRKLSGFVLFGVIPAIGAGMIFRQDLREYGLIAGISPGIWLWVAGAAILLTLLNFINSRKKDLQAAYPEMRLAEWDGGSIALAAGGWAVYMLGYEFLFRGVLLLSTFHAWGLWPAVVINLALYSALHLPKGLKEATATIPFGALVCYLTIESQSILPAIVLHSWQAITCELFCILRNPEMKLTFVKH